MALPLHDRAIDGNSNALVRLTEHGLAIDAGGTCSTHFADEGRDAVFPSLIPARPLAKGEQYRFHFNMTKCIGCRSCEVACNEQNGNPADIQWRRIGELEGGAYPDTHRHYLSMGCNHCLDAECLRGCPVNAYRKDADSGIVLHSADACIGCQYCVWNCPYGVPQFNPERGVVGKCDMCRGRLDEGLEPACVNACPEAAIEIEIVNIAEWRKNYSGAESPGMPAAGHTISTTRVTLPGRTGPALERVDSGQIRAEHAHWSLVLMTVLMQAVCGALMVLLALRQLDAGRLMLLLAGTSGALILSTTHLGRPAYAWRALKMWRRSWLSREVLLFTLFALALSTATAAAAIPAWHGAQGWRLQLQMDWIAAALGIAGTLASACIYLVPARPSWNMLHTPVDFLLTAGFLGCLVASALLYAPHMLFAPEATPRAGQASGSVVLLSAIGFAAGWICNHAVRIARLRRSALFEARASHSLLTSDPLRTHNAISFALAPLSLLLLTGGHPAFALAAGAAAALLARYLFFVSVVPLNMGMTFIRARAA
ncbi:MAG TPA: DmsC/YnfH family molybdoenzyme membrane anchor subunit [Acidobacteriaceae bacterium]|nr:DmsC/YnfH family molybdoenzyme membrane anchor subunit [Acidobacteriaceae bacterium]